MRYATHLIQLSGALTFWVSALFLYAAPPLPPTDATLAVALYVEKDWRGARAEALRTLMHAPEDETAQAIAGLARIAREPASSLAQDQAAITIHAITDAELRAWAGLQLGLIHWRSQNMDQAVTWLTFAFLQSAETDTQFLPSAYALDVFVRRHGDSHPPPAMVVRSLQALRPTLELAIAHDLNLPPAAGRRSIAERFAGGLVRFYQGQISPAIGQRCSMHPSCSVYCVEACRTYGWVGVPMTADRLVRESDHIQHRIRPVIVDGEEKFYDPIEAHSFWFRRYRP